MNNRTYFDYPGSSLLAALVLLLFWAGCGTHTRGLPPAPPSSAPVKSVDAEGPSTDPEPPRFSENESRDYSSRPPLAEERASEAPAGSMDDSADFGSGAGSASQSAPSRGATPRSKRSMARRPPRDRPGLGTVWGEQRDSGIRSTSFVRNSPNRPDATVSLHYNDRQGVAAMTRSPHRPNEGTIAFAGNLASVRVLDPNYSALPSFFAHGRRYVIGEHGDRYAIEIRNHTGGRLEVVATVDGLDVMDGRSGSIVKRGYIIAPHDVVLIEGFRTSEESVAAFRFGSVRDSYAAQKGQAGNVGVIGVALFVEESTYAPHEPWEVERRHRADPFPGRFAEPPRR